MWFVNGNKALVRGCKRGLRTGVVLVLGLAVMPLQPQADMDPSFCNVPGFVEIGGNNLDPNVIVLLDNSGSMDEPAYAAASGRVPDRFNPGRSYFGYFESDRCYRVQSNKFVEGPQTTGQWECDEVSNGNYPFSGNFLNWAYMTRLEVSKKVLVGGRFNGGSGKVVFENEERMNNTDYCIDPSPYTDLPSAAGVSLERHGDEFELKAMSYCNSNFEGEVGGGDWFCGNLTGGPHCRGVPGNGFSSADVPYASVIDDDSADVDSPNEPSGIFTELTGEARWGLFVFDDGGDFGNGGEVRHDLGFNDNGASMTNDIRTLDADSNTPSAEALHTVLRYYAQLPNFYENDEYNLGPLNRDPYYEWEGVADFVPCRKSFVLFISDGKPTLDRNIPTFLRDFDNDGITIQPPIPAPGWPPPAEPTWPQPDNLWVSDGSDYLDDVALWGNTTDLRSDLDGTQSVQSFFVFAFGDTAETSGFERSALWLMWNAAINGGFVDKNGNGIPDQQNEWDEDGDGWPDAFFLAQDGSDIKKAIEEAIAQILKRVSSGTSISVLSQSSEGEGAVFQAYFNPEVQEGNQTATWLGFTRGLWLDRFGNIREDSNTPNSLTLTEDKIMRYRFDSAQQETFVDLYEDPEGDGVTDPSDLVDSVRLEELESLFEAGELLQQRSANSRQIFTTLSDGVAPTEVDFTDANATLLAPFMDVPATRTADLINYIRGEDIAGWRNRTFTHANGTQDVWKLGDVMFSTPRVVGKPLNRFDRRFGDETYIPYFEKYKGRPDTVYVGANDGMLHAFNVGRLRNGDNPNTPQVDDAWYDPVTGDTGEELWGYIPHNLLAHLHWLKEQDYCHTYFVDNEPAIFDARIFTPDPSVHPNGWGTILVGSMRLGCKDITVNGNLSRSAIFVLDITEPRNPEVLFEFQHPDLGFTTSKPVIARIDGDWMALFGSGPTGYDFRSDQSPSLFVLNLSGGTSEVLPLPDGTNTEFVNRVLAVDFGNNYNVEAIYATTDQFISSTDFNGRIVRVSALDSNGDPSSDPNDWTIKNLFESEAPFSSAPRLGFDVLGNPLIYVGTGRFYTIEDVAYNEQQRFVAVRDACPDGSCNNVVRENDLVNVEGCMMDDSGNLDGSAPGSCPGNDIGSVCEDVRAAEGWQIEFQDVGERVLARSIIAGDNVVFPSFTPINSASSGAALCEAGTGTSRLYFVNRRCGVTMEQRDLDSEGAVNVVSAGNEFFVADAVGGIEQEENSGSQLGPSRGVQAVVQPLPAR